MVKKHSRKSLCSAQHTHRRKCCEYVHGEYLQKCLRHVAKIAYSGKGKTDNVMSVDSSPSISDVYKASTGSLLYKIVLRERQKTRFQPCEGTTNTLQCQPKES